MAEKAVPYSGDHGLGLCLGCLNERIAVDRENAAARASGDGKAAQVLPIVNWAITLAPAAVPCPGPLAYMLVPQPSCYNHLISVTPRPAGPSLLVPGN